MHHREHGDPEPDQKQKLSMMPFLDDHHHTKQSDPGLLLPTFPRAEEAVHLHAGTRVGHAECGAGNQSFLWRAAVGGSDQTPTGPLTRPLQQLHRLAWRGEQTAGLQRRTFTQPYSKENYK